MEKQVVLMARIESLALYFSKWFEGRRFLGSRSSYLGIANNSHASPDKLDKFDNALLYQPLIKWSEE